MTRSRSLTSLAGAAAISLTALALAACGGGTGTGGSGGGNATVGASTTGVGKVLVDSKGHTLYLFEKDSGMKSACAGACAGVWPPLRASGTPTVAGGAKASLVATTKRSDGAPQVTYNGHPLYTYQGDQKPGDTKGQGVAAYGAEWYAVGAAGKQVTEKSSASDGDSASNYGGGNGY
jgi:predicted lipoprotein with Yx(FWY)xxD motif